MKLLDLIDLRVIRNRGVHSWQPNLQVDEYILDSFDNPINQTHRYSVGRIVKRYNKFFVKSEYVGDFKDLFDVTDFVKETFYPNMESVNCTVYPKGNYDDILMRNKETGDELIIRFIYKNHYQQY